MQLSHAATVCLSLVLAGAVSAAPTVNIDPKGTTDGKAKASFKFTLSGLGTKKLHPTKWQKTVIVAGTTIPMTSYTTNVNNMTGVMTFNLAAVVPSGKQKVKITVILDDNSTLDGMGDVDFVMVIPNPCPCPVGCQPQPGASGEEAPSASDASDD